MVTDEQVRLLRQKRMENKTQEAAAAAAGMSVRTARTWQSGSLPSQKRSKRDWRTRPDPFAAVWDAEVVPLLRADSDGELEATTLLEELERRHPGQYGPDKLRTLQRRLRDWRALEGPERSVIFPQEHVPGREAAIDFTDCTELGVTIAGEALPHLLFLFTLSYSGWIWVCRAVSETFEALCRGIQGALWALGGVPAFLRSDNLSAATHELLSGGRELTARYRDLLGHYDLKSSRIQPGESHENGVAEKSNDVVKRALRQALVLRGSRDFPSEAAYERFVEEVVHKVRNRHVQEALQEERARLHALPAQPVPLYTTYHPTVRKWSTIQVGGRTYSVPSRLIGYVVEARQYAEVVEVYYRGRLVETMPRLRGDQAHRIDYRHVIWSLVKKPGAFARYRYREDLFPSLVFRRAYDALQKYRGERADVEYVRILHLAASTLQSGVERALATLLEEGERLDYEAVRALAAPVTPSVPQVAVPAPDLRQYDALLGGGAA
jgi:hypothetical protein